MDYNLPEDIVDMHRKFGVNEWVAKQVEEKNYEALRKFLRFRLNFLEEELIETNGAFSKADPEEVVDGLIDLIVVALGTLDAFGVDTFKAWNQVHMANISKEVGIKADRPNPLGLPDLVKPVGWVKPDHTGNHGVLPLCFRKFQK